LHPVRDGHRRKSTTDKGELMYQDLEVFKCAGSQLFGKFREAENFEL
jgi:hypothetical protein